jgi:anti-anti-sigma factor
MAFSRPERSLILDLRDVYVMDAAGLGLLVELQSWVQSRTGALKITNPSRRVRRLFALTNLQSVLNVAAPCSNEEIDEPAAEQRAMTA